LRDKPLNQAYLKSDETFALIPLFYTPKYEFTALKSATNLLTNNFYVDTAFPIKITFLSIPPPPAKNIIFHRVRCLFLNEKGF